MNIDEAALTAIRDEVRTMTGYLMLGGSEQAGRSMLISSKLSQLLSKNKRGRDFTLMSDGEIMVEALVLGVAGDVMMHSGVCLGEPTSVLQFIQLHLEYNPSARILQELGSPDGILSLETRRDLLAAIYTASGGIPF
jgi:hypothetical protein